MSKKYIEDKTFSGINFVEKELEVAEYENCTFINCTFANVDLSGMYFTECSFEGCDFSMAKLVGTAFRDINFKNCKLLGLHFEICKNFLYAPEQLLFELFQKALKVSPIHL
jgi:uncharacterized protein YjbI with pentapeptide repeats